MSQKLKFTKHELFKFPQNSLGLERFSSFKELKEAYSHLYQHCNKNNQFPWSICFHDYKGTDKHRSHVFFIRCSVCTSKIIYILRFTKQNQSELNLIKMQNHHVHISDFEKYLYFKGMNNQLQQLQIFLDTISEKNQSSQAKFKHSKYNMMRLLANIPYSIAPGTKQTIMKRNFGVGREQYNELYRQLTQSFSKSTEELFSSLQQRDHFYRYLPQDLLRPEGDVSQSKELKKQFVRDKVNPHLPNILVIITPEMKENFKKFGQVVGFDLTFSLIKEKTANNSEYMVGFFANYNHFKKIVIFGIVMTNSQTSFAYSYIFQSFFDIMGSQPETIITDEQKPLFYALKELKETGIFKGTHLFDMFHILRKFRKCYFEGQNFQLLRKMIHAANRVEYRKIFEEFKTKIKTEKQLNLLRTFDLNSHMYCYSQIPPKFVGIGVSNTCNEFYHSLIKNDIPFELNYVKTVQMVLNFIERRHKYCDTPTLVKHDMDRKMNMEFMKKYRVKVSERVFEYIMKQISKMQTIHILHSEKFRKSDDRHPIFNQFHQEYYFVENQQRNNFIVYKKDAKWSCTCELQERAGHLCAHIGKVLIHLNLGFQNNIHQRWHLNSDVIEEASLFILRLKMLKKVEKKLYFNKKQKYWEKIPEVINFQNNKNDYPEKIDEEVDKSRQIMMQDNEERELEHISDENEEESDEEMKEQVQQTSRVEAKSTNTMFGKIQQSLKQIEKRNLFIKRLGITKYREWKISKNSTKHSITRRNRHQVWAFSTGRTQIYPSFDKYSKKKSKKE